LAYLIPLHNRAGEVVAHAIVDVGDAEELSQYNWHLAKTGYAAARINGKVWTMHRWLLRDPPGQTDHINRNKVDCRRDNMRIVSDAQNKQNVPGRGGSSKHRGVSWDKHAQRWSARFGQHCHQMFRTELEAAHFISDWRRKNLPFSTEMDACSPTM